MTRLIWKDGERTPMETAIKMKEEIKTLNDKCENIRITADILRRDIEYLLPRAERCGCYEASTLRDWGIAANALVRLAYGGAAPAVDEHPRDIADLLAAERAFDRMPAHRQTPEVFDALLKYRECIEGKAHGEETMTFDKQRDGTGTREWSESSYNIGHGCANSCTYCWARSMALRFGKIKDGDEWSVEHCSANKVVKCFGKKRGVIMFPTTHDLTPGPYLEGSIVVLRSMLEAGNEVLIVSKPHLVCVKRLCDELAEFKDKIQFRFTIGSDSDGDLSFWEPGAPSFMERVDSLKWANEKVFRTSVSMEPMLCDVDHAIDLATMLSAAVTDTIWIGTMNKARQRTAWIKEDDPRRPELERRLNWIEQAAHPSNALRLYDALKDNPKIRWKDSIKAILKERGIS